MPHLYVVPGHGAGDPGACAHGYQEAERVRALAAKIKELGGDDVTLAPFDVNFYASSQYMKLDIPADWQIVELHMDSAGSGAKGAHVIYQGNYEPDQYDVALAEKVAAMFPGRANKLVGRTDLRNPNQATKIRGYAYRLVENGFISDAGDLVKFNERIADLAKLYLEAFGIECKVPEAEPVPEPETPATKKGVEVDGWWGPETTRALQRFFNTPCDGEVWHQWEPTCSHEAHVGGWQYDQTEDGSVVIKALQARLGVSQDGLMGPVSRGALMARYGCSDYHGAVEIMQTMLNKGMI